MTASKDAFYMAQALRLAQLGKYTTDPNPYVGCVIVKDAQVLAEGWTQRAGGAHAEVHALAKTSFAKGATAYVSLEPCSHHGRTGPCSEALIAAGIRRVVVAMMDPNPLVAGRGIQQLQDAGIEVNCGILAEEARLLNRGFFKRMTQRLPWITSKLACSLDGRTALANGASKWITSEQARADVQQFRAASSAILTGINTVIADNPQLNARVDFDLEQPVRVILDSRLRMPLTAKMLQDDGAVWIFTGSEDVQKQQQLQSVGCKIWQLPCLDGGLDLTAVFATLADQQINTVWVEAGATLNGSLLASGLIDEWIVYLAPNVLGDQGRGMFQLPPLQSMADKKQLQLVNCRQLGPDLRLTYQQLT